MCASNGVCPGLGKAEPAYLAVGDQFLDHACDVFHRHVGIDAVLIEQIDMTRSQPLQATVDGAADVLGLAVDATVVDACISIDIPAEFGGDLYLVADRFESFAN